MIRSLGPAAFAVAAALVLAGCQSAKIARSDRHHDLGHFDAVVVEPFDMSRCSFTGDHGEHTRDEVRDALQASLVRHLRERGLAARTVAEGAPQPGEVVVRGEFLKCDAGSGVARYFVGFGSGQSKLVCDARLFGGAQTDVPAHSLHIEGGSKGQAGFIGAGYRTLADADDAAEQIANFLAEQRAASPAAATPTSPPNPPDPPNQPVQRSPF